MDQQFHCVNRCQNIYEVSSTDQGVIASFFAEMRSLNPKFFICSSVQRTIETVKNITVTFYDINNGTCFVFSTTLLFNGQALECQCQKCRGLRNATLLLTDSNPGRFSVKMSSHSVNVLSHALCRDPCVPGLMSPRSNVCQG